MAQTPRPILANVTRLHHYMDLTRPAGRPLLYGPAQILPTWRALPILDQRAHSNRKLRFQGFCRSIRLIERVFWSFYSTVRSDMQYWLAFSWPYNLLSDKVLRITVYSCANAPAGPRQIAELRGGKLDRNRRRCWFCWRCGHDELHSFEDR